MTQATSAGENPVENDQRIGWNSSFLQSLNDYLTELVETAEYLQEILCGTDDVLSPLQDPEWGATPYQLNHWMKTWDPEAHDDFTGTIAHLDHQVSVFLQVQSKMDKREPGLVHWGAVPKPKDEGVRKS